MTRPTPSFGHSCDDSVHAHCALRRQWIPAVVAGVAFVLGNLAPPLSELVADLDPRGRWKVAEESEQKPPPAPGAPTKLAAAWTDLRAQTDQALFVAQRILIVMRADRLPAADIRAQEKKVQSLRDQRDLCDLRLRELADPPAKAASPRRDEITAVELDIEHRGWLDEARLQKILRDAK